MKRDFDLIRKLILNLEDGPPAAAIEPSFEGYTESQIGYQSHLLIEAGLAKGIDVRNLLDDYPQASLTSLTWEGHQFAELARSEAHWKSVMKAIDREPGPTTFEVLTELLRKTPLRAMADQLPSSSAIEVFVSYAHEDEELHDRLAKHLRPLEREGIIKRWHDRQITAGRDFGQDIDTVLNRAGIILLLISPDFVASEYCWGKEMLRAMERHDMREARVIPIILRPCDWHTAPFGKLLALPKDGDAVTDWPNQDNAFLSIARGIRSAAAEIKGTQPISQALQVELRGIAYTTQYRGAAAEVDVSNRTSTVHQIVRCTLEIPSLGIVLEHSPGPPSFHGGAPWLPRCPILLEGRKLTRGSLFFRAGAGQLQDGLPAEPLAARLKFEFFLEPPIQLETELNTFDTIRRFAQESSLPDPQERNE
jgi:hypothetical protein